MLDEERDRIVFSVRIELLDAFDKLRHCYPGVEANAYLHRVEERMDACGYDDRETSH